MSSLTLKIRHADGEQVTLDGEENVVEFIRMAVDHVEQGVTVASQENELLVAEEILREEKVTT